MKKSHSPTFTLALYIEVNVCNKKTLNVWAKEAWEKLEELGATRIWWHGIHTTGREGQEHEELFQLEENENDCTQ